MEQMICVTVFPAAAAFRCLKIASPPVTTNFTLTHPIACVHLSVVFKRNWNGIHPCRAEEEKKKLKQRLKFRLVKQCIIFSDWPDACRSNLFEGRWTCGRMKHKRGSLFWLRHTPFPFTTIQPLSYSKPRGPNGQSWTCMKSKHKVKSKQRERKSDRKIVLGCAQTSYAPHDLMGYM